MKINWKERFKNPVFWAKVAIAIFVPMLAGVGAVWEDMTTWAALWDVIVSAVANPVTIGAIIVSVYSTAIDPTTPGIGDSERALQYKTPGGK